MTEDSFSGPASAGKPCSSVFDRIELSSSSQPGLAVRLEPVLGDMPAAVSVPLADAIRQALLGGVAALSALEGDGAGDVGEHDFGDAPVRSDQPASGPSGFAVPEGLVCVPAVIHHPFILVGRGDDRASFASCPRLECPGAYILLSGQDAYVGGSGNVRKRIYSGHRHSAIDMLITITDAHGEMTHQDAKTVERLIWNQMQWAGEYRLLNKEAPDGAPVAVEDFERLRMFVAEAVLALRQTGALFTTGSTRRQVSGPRAEPGRLGDFRQIDEVPEGEVMELSFHGLSALAAARDDGTWLLLRGSDVRVDTVASATASASHLRGEWLSSGILELANDGSCYVLKRDMIFGSGSAVSHFLTGSKGKSLAAWHPIVGADTSASR